MLFTNLKNLSYNKKLQQIKKSFKPAKADFNTKAIDSAVEAAASGIYENCKSKFKKCANVEKSSIAILATELYGTGGHTPCLSNFVKSFHNDFQLNIFLSRLSKTNERLPDAKLEEIQRMVPFHGINSSKKGYASDIINLYNLIVESAPGVIFVYTHPNDVTSAAVLSLIKSQTQIKVVFFNHADHFPSLSMKFSDKIIDARPAGYNLTREKRGYKNNLLIDLQGKSESENALFSKKEVIDKKLELGFKADDLISMTGCTPYKLFDTEESSSYFTMIRDLLTQHKTLNHLIVSNFNELQLKVINNIFKNHEEPFSRLKIVPIQSNFDLLIQLADIFIDSFPQGSALTHIDCMRNKTPTVVKINKEDQFKSFEYYLPENYQYKYESVDAMKDGITQLVNSLENRNETAAELYNYFINRFEFQVVKGKYKQLIEGILNENS